MIDFETFTESLVEEVLPHQQTKQYTSLSPMDRANVDAIFVEWDSQGIDKLESAAEKIVGTTHAKKYTTIINSMVTEGLIPDDKIVIDEATYKRIIRVDSSGKKVRKKKCPKGFRMASGRCIVQSADEKRKRKKGAKKAARKRRGKKAQIQRKRKKALTRRRSMGL